MSGPVFTADMIAKFQSGHRMRITDTSAARRGKTPPIRRLWLLNGITVNGAISAVALAVAIARASLPRF
ncbi:MAG: hypothetical protein P8Y67_14050 [Alphaproteobacteria bacterium]